ncbi:MAG: TerB family tellurite resistance protein [Planctomycetota bacterium]
MIDEQNAEAIVTVGLIAAMADGRTGGAEREQLKSLMETLSADHELPSLASIHQAVVLKRVGLDDALARLSSDDAKRMCFEIAVCVTDANGDISDREQRFLDHIESRLGLDHAEAVAFEQDAVAVAGAPAEVEDRLLDPAELLGGTGDASLAPVAVSAAPAPSPAASPAAVEVDPRREAVDGTIMKYSILNGALELLPQNLATMAILPLQTRMVYAIGRAYGHKLGAGHIKEFIATLGVGATSQMLENFARKALGKLAKKALGKTAGKMVKAATGPMMTFATTFAIGRVADAYYSGGRKLSAVDLRAIFQRDLAKGKALYESHRPQIEQNARSLNPGRVLDMVRGKA